MKNSCRIFSACTIAACLLGCAGQPMKVTGVTDLSTIDPTRGREVVASGAGFQLFGFIPLSVNDRQQRAYEELVKKAGNDAIANISVQETWRYAVIGWIFRTTIHAMGYPKVDKAETRKAVQSFPHDQPAIPSEPNIPASGIRNKF